MQDLPASLTVLEMGAHQERTAVDLEPGPWHTTRGPVCGCDTTAWWPPLHLGAEEGTELVEITGIEGLADPVRDGGCGHERRQGGIVSGGRSWLMPDH
jgi:hypothetical protein